MLQLNFISIDANAGKAKATVHITGKLGFNKEAEKLMKLSEQTYFRVAIDGEIANFKNVYLVEHKQGESDSIKVSKAGSYYYLNTASVFDTLKLKYNTHRIIFDIERSEYENKTMFILKRRRRDITRKEKEIIED
jgi:hypothetical protein